MVSDFLYLGFVRIFPDFDICFMGNGVDTLPKGRENTQGHFLIGLLFYALDFYEGPFDWKLTFQDRIDRFNFLKRLSVTRAMMFLDSFCCFDYF